MRVQRVGARQGKTRLGIPAALRRPEKAGMADCGSRERRGSAGVSLPIDAPLPKAIKRKSTIRLSKHGVSGRRRDVRHGGEPQDDWSGGGNALPSPHPCGNNRDEAVATVAARPRLCLNRVSKHHGL